jgi:hypothetical protein
MKCKYTYCHHGGEVNKDEAIKIGNLYFHKDCYHEKQTKQEIEDYYLKNMPSCTLQILRKVIKQLIHEKSNSADYVLFTLKYIKSNNKPINNPFGLINYCNDYKLKNEFDKQLINEKYKLVKSINELDIDTENEVKFTYQPSKKKVTDIL